MKRVLLRLQNEFIRLSGLSPFLGDNDNETECNIAANEWDFDAEEFDDVSSNGKDFIEKLLVPSSTERLSSEQSLEHPWIARCGEFSVVLFFGRRAMAISRSVSYAH